MHVHVVDFKYSELRFLWKQGFYASTLETLVVQGKPGFLDSLIPYQAHPLNQLTLCTYRNRFIQGITSLRADVAVLTQLVLSWRNREPRTEFGMAYKL